MSWNRANINNGTTSRSISSRATGILVVAAALAVVGGSVFLFSNRNARPTTEEKPVVKGKIKEQEPSIPGQKDSKPDTENAEDKPVPSAPKTWLGQEIKGYAAVTSGATIVETFVTADGKTHKYYHDTRENVLPSAADQILAIMTAENDGFGAPPLPNVGNFEDAFGDALKHKIVIEKDDTDEIRLIKERVLAARKELLDLMAQGVNANDVIEEYRRTQEDNATVRLDAALKVNDLLKAGDIKGAKELCAKYNEVLTSANIMNIEIPEEYLKEDAPNE